MSTFNQLSITTAGRALALMGLTAALFACAQRQQGPPGGQGGFAMPVASAPIARGSIAEYFQVTGVVSPLQSAALSSVVSGSVVSVGAQIGQHVHQGDLLVQIDPSTLSAQQAQAAANLAQVSANTQGGSTTAHANLSSAKVANDTAQANLRRNQQLFNQGYVSKSALEQAQGEASAADAAYRAALVAAQNASLKGDDSAAVSAMKSAQAAVGAVNAQLSQTSVRAPFDGVVTARNVDPGSLATPGTVLMEVAQIDRCYVDVGISGANLAAVHVGTPAKVTIAGFGDRTWQGHVAYLNSSAMPGTLIYQARIPLANPDLTLHGGMIATASFQTSRKTGVLLAPRAAVFQTDTGYSMFVIDGGKAKAVPVDVGIQNDQQVEVSGPGLKPGVQAILNHSVLLQPGTPVQPMSAKGGKAY
jgi:HlyD family secretion protein